MFKSIIKSNRGLTLIEMLVAITLGLIGIAGSYSLLVGAKGTLEENNAALRAQQDARNIVHSMARELRESSPKTVSICSWTSPDGEAADCIFFYTPRDENKKFVVGATGEPNWQREIAYGLDYYTHHLYRFQYYLSSNDEYPCEWEIMSKNVEKLSFSRVNDLININIRTFANDDQGVGHVTRTYADYHTMVKMRN